jgi:acetyl-CoA carboxylase carboxyltransferase component
MSLAIVQRPVEQLSPLERLTTLCDAGSLRVIRSEATSARMGERAVPGDGVVGGAGRIGDRPVFCYAQDATFAGGSLGATHAETILRVLRLADRARVPVVGFVESAGARIQEGLAALSGYAEIFRETVALSGLVPQISIVTGKSAGGGCYSPALTDFVIMTEESSMFLTGPAVVQQVTGEEVDAAGLGGARVHERNGVCHLVAPTEVDAALLARELLGYLPQGSHQSPPRSAPRRSSAAEPGRYVPRDDRTVYDVRDVVRGIVDNGDLLELAPRWARNVVTGFARLEGQGVGVVANQPRHLGGVLDAEAAQKAARFVRTCNSFGVPLVVLVDTPGFLPGTRQEAQGVIRHGAKLLHAFSQATVPRFTVILRKAYGGAYIAMNSRELGAHLTLAWPRAKLGILGPRQAAEIVYRRELAATGDRDAALDRLADEYAKEHLTARAAAREGFIDEVIPPRMTRDRLLWGLSTFGSVRGNRCEGNIPL